MKAIDSSAISTNSIDESPRAGRIPAGPVRLIVLLSEEDESGAVWDGACVCPGMGDEIWRLSSDIYTLADGQPVDAAR